MERSEGRPFLLQSFLTIAGTRLRSNLMHIPVPRGHQPCYSRGETKLILSNLMHTSVRSTRPPSAQICCFHNQRLQMIHANVYTYFTSFLKTPNLPQNSPELTPPNTSTTAASQSTTASATHQQKLLNLATRTRFNQPASRYQMMIRRKTTTTLPWYHIDLIYGTLSDPRSHEA